jgi:putative ABC transport system permease protein
MMRSEVLLAEVGQTWRAMLLRPSYLLLAGLTLAFGVAASVSVLALVRASLLAPIAVPEIERVVLLGSSDGYGVGGLSPIQAARLSGLPGVEALGAAAPATSIANVLVGDRTDSVTSWQANEGFLRALGIPMRLGRGFNEAESRPDGPPAAIVSQAWWEQRLGGSNDVLNQVLRIGGRTIPIVGVLPASFPFHDAEIVLPLPSSPTDTSWSGGNTVIARLTPGTSLEAAGSALTARLRPLDVEYNMDRFEGHDSYAAQPLEQALRAGTGSSEILSLFAACAAVVLLIVAVNLSNLALLRLVARGHDHAVRQALGAPGLRLLLPAVAEQVLVAIVGAAAGVAGAWLVLRVANSVIPPYWFVSADARPEIGFEGTAIALGLALAVAITAVALAAWRSRRVAVREALVSGGRTGLERSGSRLGRVLVSLQAALATVLLLMAALCARTLWISSQVESGYDGAQVVGFSLKPDRQSYPDQQSVLIMAEALVARLEALPGAERAAYGTNMPASGTDHNDTAPFITEKGATLDSVPAYLISASYLSVLGLPIEQGRDFDQRAGANAATAIISSDLRKIAPEETALGRRITLPLHSVNADWADLPLQVRGVSRGLHIFGPARARPPVVWIPFGTETANLFEVWRDANSLFFMLKVRGEPGAFRDQVVATVREVAPTLAVMRLKPLSEYQWETLAHQQLNLALILSFAGVALLLSSVGMYSVMAVSVAARSHELGVRAALGATPARLLREVLTSGMLQLAAGLIVGLVFALAASKLLQRFLFGVSTADPLSIAGVLVLLLLTGLLACLGPGLRAARVQPMQALRMD